MAIVKMSKFNLFSFSENRDELIDELQRFEYIHFSDTEEIAEEQELENVKVPHSIEENERKLNEVEWLLEVLEPRLDGPSGIKAMKEGLKWYSIDELKEKAIGITYEETYKDVRNNVNAIEDAKQEIHTRQGLIGELEPWKNLDSGVSSLESTDNVNIVSGSVKTKDFDDLVNEAQAYEGTYIEKVDADSRLTYFIAIIIKEEYNEILELLRDYSFSSIEIPGEDTPVNEIARYESEIKEYEEKIAEYENNIDGYTGEVEDLQLLYEYLTNKRLELAAIEKFVGLEEVDVIQGYVPTEKTDEFTKSLDRVLDNMYFLEVQEAERSDDTTPVLLENNSLIKPFESVTTMYSTPKYSEIDPTPFLSIFYWVFFGMMVADLGYGAVLFILTGIALLTFNTSEGMRNTLKFFFMLSISTMIWGLIYGSAFGISLPFHLIDSSDNIFLLIMAIVFGAIHLFFGLALQGYMYIRDGDPMSAVYDVLLWYMALIGGALFLMGVVGIVPDGISTIGMWVMIVGMVGIVLFGGRSANGVPARLALGAYELYGISSWVGDFVSYSRLMALGLSGGFIAMAINMIVGLLPKNPIGIIAGIIIFIGGHAFNIFLSYLSAYVHDIRLTYVEFFGKFFEGGGQAFNLFKNDTKYINIK